MYIFLVSISCKSAKWKTSKLFRNTDNERHQSCLETLIVIMIVGLRFLRYRLITIHHEPLCLAKIRTREITVQVHDQINRDNKNNSLKDILILLYIFNVYCGTIEGRIVKDFKVSFENTQSNHHDQNSELNILKIKSLIWDIFVLSNRMAKNQSKSCNFLYILQGIYKKCF